MSKTYKVNVLVNILQKTNYWIAYSPDLKTFGYSNVSQEDAINDFESALKTFFFTQERLGKIHETLRSLGWTGPVGTGANLVKPQIPNIFPERRYRAKSANTIEREIEVPAA